MVKWGTEEIPRPSMGQKPGGKWKHWGLPHFQQNRTLLVLYEKACGVKFLKHGSTVNFSKVVGGGPCTLWGEAKIERSRDILARKLALTSTQAKIFFYFNEF